MKTYVTFGTEHVHEINGKHFDHNSVALIEGDSAAGNRAKAFDLFGPKFAFEYPEDVWDMESMRFYPRGIIPVDMKKHLIITLEYDMGDYTEWEEDGNEIPTDPDDIGLQDSFYQSDVLAQDMKIVGARVEKRSA